MKISAIKWLTISRLFIHITVAIFNILLIFYVVNILKGNTSHYGYIEGAKYLGITLSSFLLIPIIERFNINANKNFIWGSLITGLSVSAFSFIKSVPIAGIVYFINGIGQAGLLISINSLYTFHSPEHLQASIRALADWVNRLWGLIFMIIVFILVKSEIFSVISLLRIAFIGSVIGSVVFYVCYFRKKSS